MTRMTVVLAEDHAVTADGLRSLIESTGRFEVLDVAADGARALAATIEFEPDLLFLDLVLPKQSGLAVLQRVKALPRPPKVVIYTGQASALDFERARSGGADGLVSKGDSPEAVLEAIESVLAGKRFMSPSVLALLGPEHHLDIVGLTEREKEVLSLVAAGLTSAAIGEQLAISPMTVKKHRENLMRKLGAKNAVEAARIAADLGLLGKP